MVQEWRLEAMNARGRGWLNKIVVSIFLVFVLEGSGYAMDVTLAWDAGNGTDLAGYLVYYGTVSGAYTPSSGDYATRYSVDGGQNWISVTGAPPITVGPDVTEIRLTGLNDSKDYFFALKAFNSTGLKSPYSTEISVISPSNIAAPYNRGWKITNGAFAGFTVLYNSDTDPGITPTLGSPGDIPAFDLPGLNAVGTRLNLQPDGSVFSTPVAIFFPCPGYNYISDFSIGLYEAGEWKLAWDGGTQELTATGADWIDGLPQYIPGKNPPAIRIAVKHFSGVQAGAPPSGAPTGGAITGASGGGGGGGCFISTARGNGE
jgi:hypothetical protein